jgi:hypothetical protein
VALLADAVAKQPWDPSIQVDKDDPLASKDPAKYLIEHCVNRSP